MNGTPSIRKRLTVGSVLGLLLSALLAVCPLAGAEGDEPLPAYVLLIDRSNSMKDAIPGWKRPTMEVVREALAEFTAALPDGTEVEVHLFDQDLDPGRTVRLTGPAERAALRAYFASLEHNPKGWTFAWKYLDQMLGRARSRTQREPGQTVRVLLYTDGDDTEDQVVGPSKRTKYEDVLARYTGVLRGPVEATIVTMGFTLKEDKKKIEKAGIDVVDALDKSKLKVATALFDWTPARPVRGKRVQMVDKSLGPIASWTWDFGDRETSAEKAPAHVFRAAGPHRVRLVVRDYGGHSSTASRVIDVGEPEGLEARGKVSPTEVPLGLPIQCVSESRGAIAKYRWQFGDGGDAPEANPSHVYARPGEYRITLTVSGEDGTESSADVGTVRVVAPEPPKPPVAEFLFPAATSVGSPADFYDRSAGGGPVDAWSWDFGDGTPVVTTADVRHVFAEAGRRKVSLTVSGPGGRASVSHEVEVRPLDAPVADFVVGDPRPAAGAEIPFTDESTGDVRTAAWTFEPGSAPVERDYAGGRDASRRTVGHVFARPGTYRVRLEVVAAGGRDAKERDVVVVAAGTRPVAKFSAKPRSGHAPLAVTFTNESTGGVKRFTWTFGDGTSEPQEGTGKVQHTFKEPKTYTVRLVAEGSADYPSSEDTTTIEVTLPPPPPTWWQRNWWWVVPVGLVALGLILWGAKRSRAKRRYEKAFAAARLVPSGRLAVRPSSEPEGWTAIPVKGGTGFEEVLLPPATASAFEGLTVGLVSKPEGVVPRPVPWLEMRRDGMVVESLKFDSPADLQVRGFVFRFESDR